MSFPQSFENVQAEDSSSDIPVLSLPKKSRGQFFSNTTLQPTSTMTETTPKVPPAAPLPAESSNSQPFQETQEKPLPKLTPFEFRQYNRMAEHMDYFHNHFRETWTMMMTACETSKRPNGMSIRQFLTAAEQFVQHLSAHHSIEERHIFPVLAKKMPAFRKELELLTQHKVIHQGVDKLEAYLEACRNGEKELRLSELKEILDTFGAVLWKHLDDEVKQLGAENMRKYWTVEEMRRMPM